MKLAPLPKVKGRTSYPFLGHSLKRRCLILPLERQLYWRTKMTEVPLLPEYAENPFIAGLGPMLTLEQIQEKITIVPRYSREERRQHPTYRRHCCLRLLQAFFPLTSQVRAVDNLHMMIRDGYLGRNPLTGSHQRAFLNAVDRVEQNDIQIESDHEATSTVGSAANIGVPGMGKSTTFELGAKLFPAVLRPVIGYEVTQIPVIPVLCPSEGSVKQFCRNFFKAVDKRVGWNRYSRQFGKDKIPAETMLLHVQHLAHMHAIGVIVVDEIQNLMSATGKNAGALMKFYVTMTNTIGVPVLLIGTMSATEVLQQGFHAARRGDGYGSQVWDRAADGPEWRTWFKQVWQFQWLSQRTKLTDELAQAMYQETQGVLDLAVKLHMLVQLHVITRSEWTGDPEVITKEVIELVAAERLNMVKPMILAMRDGNVAALDGFRDISGYQVAIDEALAQLAGLTTEDYRRRKAMEEASKEAPLVNDPFHMVRASLEAQGFTEKEINAVIQKAETMVPSGDHLLIMQHILELVAAANAARTSPRKPRRPKTVRQPVNDPSDVRNRTGDRGQGGQAEAA